MDLAFEEAEDYKEVKLVSKFKNNLIAMYKAAEIERERKENDSSTVLEKKKKGGERSSMMRRKIEESVMKKLASNQVTGTKV